MSFNPPVRATPDRIRQFDGVGGPVTQVLVRRDDSGRNISGSIANEVYDFFLGERGSMELRHGCRKIEATGKLESIIAIFKVTLSGVQQYAMIYGEVMDLIALGPTLDYSPIPIPLPPSPPSPSPWPAGWPKPDEPEPDVPPSDPSVPPEEQACAVAYTWDSDPDTLTFTMPYGGPVPTSQYWFWKKEGYSAPLTFTGTFNVDPYWLESILMNGYSWDIGPCHGISINTMLFAITGKDQFDAWLAPGVYSFTKGIVYNDGGNLSTMVQLTVLAPDISVSPTSYTANGIVVGDAGNKTEDFLIGNTGESGSICRWTAAITGDALLTAKMALSVSSGSINAGDIQACSLTITNPGALAAGTYNATITFSEPSGKSQVVPVQIQVVPAYIGQVKVTWTRTTQAGFQGGADYLFNYAASASDFEPAWSGSFIDGLTFRLGKAKIPIAPYPIGTWCCYFQDPPYWAQNGGTDAWSRPLNGFAANGCPILTPAQTWTVYGPGFITWTRWSITVGPP